MEMQIDLDMVIEDAGLVNDEVFRIHFQYILSSRTYIVYETCIFVFVHTCIVV